MSDNKIFKETDKIETVAYVEKTTPYTTEPVLVLGVHNYEIQCVLCAELKDLSHKEIESLLACISDNVLSELSVERRESVIMELLKKVIELGI